MNPRDAAKIIWEGKQQGKFYPEAVRGISSIEEGYRVQMELLSLEIAAGEEQAGWKVGLTAKSIQEQVGYHDRVFGHLLKSREQQSGVILDSAALFEPWYENELCVTMGGPLQGPGVTVAQARAAIAAIAPAVELIERRGDTGGNIALAMADNAEQRNFITGSVTSPLAAEVDLQQTTLDIFINGELQEQAEGSAVLEGPEGSVAWLANRLVGFGRQLHSGDKIMTGSFTKQYPAKPGESYEARFHPFGSVLIQVK